MFESNPFDTLVDDSKPREQQIEDIALSFFALAEKLEAARIGEIDQRTYEAIMDANSYMWVFTANLVKYNYWDGTPEDTKLLLQKIADFMSRAGQAVIIKKDDNLLAKMVAMNVNMCNHILDQRKVEIETGQASLAGLSGAAKPIYA